MYRLQEALLYKALYSNQTDQFTNNENHLLSQGLHSDWTMNGYSDCKKVKENMTL